MYTYKLSSNSKRELQALKELGGVEQFYCSKYRAVLRSKRELEIPDTVKLEELYRGDCFDAVVSWADTNVVDELHGIFMQGAKKIRQSQRDQAIRAWVQSEQDLEAAKEALEKASRASEQAVRKMLLTFGRCPVTIADSIYDPSYVRERPIYLKRPERKVKP
jgi:hypothetical protein